MWPDWFRFVFSFFFSFFFLVFYPHFSFLLPLFLIIIKGGTSYGSLNDLSYLGSGGGFADSSLQSGGHGGGFISISSSSLSLHFNGLISSNGEDGESSGDDSAPNGGGGGSGGSIIINSDQFFVFGGEIHANGGNGGIARNGGRNGGAGSGGRIHVDTINYPVVYVSGNDVITAYGGIGCESQRAEVGTVKAFCEPGMQITSTECEMCNPGEYSPFGSVCRTCPSGSFTSITGATSASIFTIKIIHFDNK